MKMATPAVTASPCLFCNIINKTVSAEILHEDEDVVVFRDIKPASRYHSLTIPKRHIDDVKALKSEDKELLSKMLLVTRSVLSKQSLPAEDVRLGYHWPPCRSVRHLHLHCIAPETEMGYLSRFVFWKDSYWFVSPEYVASTL